MNRAGLPALVAAALTACTVGPDYHGPPHDLTARRSVSGPFAELGHANAAELPLPDHWWRLYNDSRLDDLVVAALAANEDLRSAEANIRAAMAVVAQAKAARTPATALAGGVSYGQDGIPTPSASGFLYSIAGSVTYPVDLFGGIRRGIEAAQDGAEAAVAARDEVRVVVAAGVIRGFVAACSANRSYAAASNVLAIQQHTLETVERLFRGGRATAFDVSRAQAAVEQSAALLPGLIATRRSAVYQLATLLGRPPLEFPVVAEQCTSPPSLNQPIPVGNGDALLRRRPDIRAAERDLAAATATVGVNVAQLYPAISLGGSAASAAPFSLFGSNSSVSFSVGPLVTWTFPNQRAIRAEIARAGAGADAAAANFDATVIEALRQAETALSNYAYQLDNESALRRARTAAASASEQAERLYRFGRTDFINVLSAEAALANADAALSQSAAVLADDQVSVFQALGGGWEP